MKYIGLKYKTQGFAMDNQKMLEAPEGLIDL